jgi:hypothetical protein
MGRGTNIYQSGELLLTMLATVEHLINIGVTSREFYRDSEIKNRILLEGVRFKDIVESLRKRIKDEEQEHIRRQAAAKEQLDIPLTALRFSQFLNYLTQSPLASETFRDQVFDCVYEERDVSLEATGYAAHFTQRMFEGTGGTAAVVSLDNHPMFNRQWLSVLYSCGEQTEDRDVWNVVRSEHVRDVYRTFEHNPKHTKATVVDGMTVAAMDLCGTDAQNLLNQAASLPGEDRVFARHQRRIYVFPCHRKETRTYHGYPVEPAELRQRMSDIASALYRHFKWEELKP